MLRNFAKKLVGAVAGMSVVSVAGAVAAGCLDRPVTNQSPTIKTNFTSAVSQSGINKVDILFDIDNSASMGDKQTYLIQAIPQMIARLVTPQCVDSNGNPVVPAANADPTTGECVTGAPEFTAVHDMHIGIVTSSLGPRLGNGTCEPTMVTSAAGTMVSAYNDDQGHLINRIGSFGSGGPLSDAALTEGGGFLYWFPTLGNSGATAAAIPATHLTTIGAAGAAGTLVGDFTELIQGVGESGCGIESQLESWYRFLVQPDPYESLDTNDPVTHGAEWVGVDATIIQQRHDFLRPDSLLAVIVLSDENDSEVDVRAFQGAGYYFMGNSYSPSRATTECATDPLNATGKCVTCPANCAAGATTFPCSDANCQTTGGVFNSSDNTWGYNLNLRHVHPRQKYGLDFQFPLSRYYTGLTSATVPNRLGEYPSSKGGYAGTKNCTNPIFASKLPTGSSFTAADYAEGTGQLCALPTGAIRTPADVFYAHIGGVPHQLLQVNPTACAANCTGAATDPASCASDCAQKDTLASTDWKKILGTGTSTYASAFAAGQGATASVSYDYTGIDPHMIEAQAPRNIVIAGTPNSNPAVSTLSGPGFGTGADPVRPDPINGREWITNTGVHSLSVDREYACIFQLPLASQRDCASYEGNTIEGNSCDCIPGSASAATPWSSGGAAAAANNPDTEVLPLCSKTSTDGTTITSKVNDYTVQTYAKAYPTIRELTLAEMMGGQGIVSSLCPIHPNDNAAGNDPLYGYRPAVNAIVDRLKNALGATCVPKLTPTAAPAEAGAGKVVVPCLVLVSFGPTSAQAGVKQGECASIAGGIYSEPDPSVLKEFKGSQPDASGIGAETTCALKQVALTPGATCANHAAGEDGWCYVTGASGSSCSQQIEYSSTSLVSNGTTINLQCISTNTAATDASAASTSDAK